MEATGKVVVNLDKVAQVARWMKEGKHNSLIMMGGVGAGKTTLAKALCSAIGVKDKMPLFRPMWYMTQTFKDNPDLFYEDLREKCYLLIDDAGSEKSEVKSYGNSCLLFNEIISVRYDYRLPVIITTNLNSAALRERYGDKIMSRLREMCDVIDFQGADLHSCSNSPSATQSLGRW